MNIPTRVTEGQARYLNTKQAATYSGLSEATIRNRIRSGELKAYRSHRRVLVDIEEIDRFIRGSNTEPQAEGIRT
jgi:excisionase family DNA binding protein